MGVSKYLYAVALALFLCLSLFAYIESERVDSLKADNKVLKDKVEASEAARALEHKQLLESNKREVDYNDIISAQKENIYKLRDSVDNGSKRVLVHAKCTMPETNSSASGITEARIEPDSTFRQAYFDLYAGIKRLETKLNYCQDELLAR